MVQGLVLKMKSLIIGTQGLVGSALTRCLPNAIQGIPMEGKYDNSKEKPTNAQQLEDMIQNGW